jgi:thiamine biosynthesis lipoprotein ApbE
MPYTIKCSVESFANPEYAHVRVEQIASSVFQEVESKLSTFNPDSEVNKVNFMGVDDVHIMSDALKEVVLCSKELVKLTRGAFDPCVSPLLKHYESMAERTASLANDSSLRGSTHSNGSNHERLSSITELPELDDSDEVDIETIRRQRHVVDYWRSLVSAGFAGDPSDLRVSRTVRQLLEISQWHSGFSVALKDTGTGNDDHDKSDSNLGMRKEYVIRKKHIDARMDLNGIAKGWAVDKIAEALPSSCWVEWGGDIKVRGHHPSGRCWQVAIVEPPSLAEMKLRLARARQAGQKGPVVTLADEHMKDEARDVNQTYLAVLDLRDGEAVATSGDYESKSIMMTLPSLFIQPY